MLFVLIVSSLSLIQAQQKTITGIVSDESGPLPGVRVLIKGITHGVQTDFDGKYAIKASETDVLVFSFVGMKTEERKVGSKNTINILLTEDSSVLEEVVIAGYAASTDNFRSRPRKVNQLQRNM